MEKLFFVTKTGKMGFCEKNLQNVNIHLDSLVVDDIESIRPTEGDNLFEFNSISFIFWKVQKSDFRRNHDR